MTVEAWLTQRATTQKDNVFIDDGKQRLTYGACYEQASKFAHVLHQLSRPRIGVYVDNSMEAVILINAAWLAGIEIAMLNTRLTTKEMIAQMHSIHVDTVIATMPLTLDASIKVYNYQHLESFLTEESYVVPYDENRIASIMFTSGTTGPQKAVPQTFKNHEVSAKGCEQSLGFDRNSVWLSVLPIYHISGLSVMLRALTKGFTMRLEHKFDAQRMLRIIMDEEPTHVSLVPQTLKWLMDAGLHEPYHLEKILLGGAKLSAGLVQQALEYHLPIYNSFGMTETCSQFLTAAPEMLAERPDTVGKPSDNVIVKIKQPNKDGHGELLIRGDNVMNGYLYPEGLTDVFEEGYFNTGDIAEIDDQGYVMIYDRRKDLIISGGENIYPYEIESAAKQYPGIVDAMCVPVTDDTWGQTPYLYYISEHEIETQSLQQHFQQHLAKYKIPKSFERVTQLPYTSTGKLQRGRL